MVKVKIDFQETDVDQHNVFTSDRKKLICVCGQLQRCLNHSEYHIFCSTGIVLTLTVNV